MNKLKALTVVIVSFLATSVCTFAAPSRQKPVEAAVVIDEFRKHVEKVPFFSDSAVTAAKNEIEEHIKCLRNWSDRKAYVEEHHLNTYLAQTATLCSITKGWLRWRSTIS